MLSSLDSSVLVGFGFLSSLGLTVLVGMDYKNSWWQDVIVNVDCHLARIWDHLVDNSLGMPMRQFYVGSIEVQRLIVLVDGSISWAVALDQIKRRKSAEFQHSELSGI